MASVISAELPPQTISADDITAEVTRLLHDRKAGDRDDRFQMTALVREAYVRRFGQGDVDWRNRGHFFALAGQLMRQIMVAAARRERPARRGCGLAPSALDETIAAPTTPANPVDALDLDCALRKLERIEPTQAQIVELRFFAGLSVDETAAALRLSPATVRHHWGVAKIWLSREWGFAALPEEDEEEAVTQRVATVEGV